MIRRLLIYLLIIGNLQGMQGQFGYNETYDNGVSLRFLSIGTRDNTLYISGFYNKEVSSYQSGFIAALDTLGEMQWWTEFSDDSSSITMNEEIGISIDEMNIIWQPFVYFDRPSYGIAVVESSGNIRFVREYMRDSGSVTSPRDIVQVSDGYLITGWTSNLQIILLMPLF